MQRRSPPGLSCCAETILNRIPSTRLGVVQLPGRLLAPEDWTLSAEAPPVVRIGEGIPEGPLPPRSDECSPPQVHHKSLSLGEVLDGDRMAESLYQIRFRENVEKKPLCHLTLTETQVFVDTTQTRGLAWELMIRKQPEHMRSLIRSRVLFN